MILIMLVWKNGFGGIIYEIRVWVGILGLVKMIMVYLDKVWWCYGFDVMVVMIFVIDRLFWPTFDVKMVIKVIFVAKMVDLSV